jgi:glycosyltransferase involved in cell wall biosynthesis
MLAQLFPRERVYWTDYVSPTQVSAFLASADIAVLPFVDGASLRRTTLLSMLLHGLPTLTTSGAGTIRDGLGEEAGVQLVPPANIPALANAIKVLASDPAERQRLSVHARAFANRFTWSSVAHQTLTIYDQVINAYLL